MTTDAERLLPILDANPKPAHSRTPDPDYPSWGSPALGWATDQLTAAGWVGHTPGGIYKLPDGSGVKCTWLPSPNPTPGGYDYNTLVWQAVTVHEVAAKERGEVGPNDIGLTNYQYISDPRDDETYEHTLAQMGVAYTTADLPHIVGMAGIAHLILYTSPRTGQPVTVLVIPHRPDIDDWGIEYFLFAGMPRDLAMADEHAWIDRYDRALQTVRSQQVAP